MSFHDAKFANALHRDRQCRQTRHPAFNWLDRRGGKDWPKVDNWILTRLHAADTAFCEARGEAERPFDEWLTEFENRRTEGVQKFLALPKRRTEEADSKVGETQEDYFEDLESCFRTLKLAMEDKRDRAKEGEFFQLELKARRRRREPNVPGWERFISDLYGATSQYGNSVVRPIFWILGSLVVFAVLYAFQGSSSLLSWDWHWPAGKDWGQAFSYSAGRILGFGPWESAPEACTLMGDLLNVKDDTGECGWGVWSEFWVRGIASLQTLLALILVFLSGLAVRRRFQIN